MKLYLEKNVFDAAIDRLNWIFDEFENVVVNFSGGKDSTTILNLALRVAEERGRLPLPVLFIDQEAEWQSVIDYIRQVMADPRVEPRWYQVPIRLFNATSNTEPWLMCWEPGKEWMREKEPGSFHDNTFGTDRFKELFDAILKATYPSSPAVNLTGMRASESPARLQGLTTYETYKGATWGRRLNVELGHYNLCPIWDWTDTDVWKAIHSNGWPYCPIYDAYFRYGVAFNRMRVSNLHHETAIHVLYYLQEIEGETWEKLTARLAGISTVGQLQSGAFIPKELPGMFADWREYRDHLIENLIVDPAHKARFRTEFARQDGYFKEGAEDFCAGGKGRDVAKALGRNQVAQVLTNDFEMTKWRSFATAFSGHMKKGRTQGRKLFEDAGMSRDTA